MSFVSIGHHTTFSPATLERSNNKGFVIFSQDGAIAPEDVEQFSWKLTTNQTLVRIPLAVVPERLVKAVGKNSLPKTVLLFGEVVSVEENKETVGGWSFGSRAENGEVVISITRHELVGQLRKQQRAA